VEKAFCIYSYGLNNENMERKHGSKKIVDAILSRRSIRKFKPEKVDREIIKELLEVGRSAPSRGNSQPWHFVVVTDDKTKKDLADACYGQELVEEAAFCIVVLGKIDPREDVPDRTAELVEAGAFGQEVKEFADHILDDWDLAKLKVDAALNSAIPATFMSIAALDFGLGSCWVKLAKDEEVLNVVSAPDGYYHTGTIAFGFPDQDPKARPRLPIKQIVSNNKFGIPYNNF